jgi:uncharacterized protein
MAALARSLARIADVPALACYRGSPELAMERGTVLFYHGFGGSKDGSSLYYVTALAEAGFLAVSLDAVGHGERRLPEFDVIFNDKRWDANFEQTESDFLKLIDDTAAEAPAVIDDLVDRGWARADRIGICGRSLGGNICYAAVLADPRVRAMASIVGSPEWTLPRAHSPHLHPDRFFPVAVLSQAAELDQYVPAEPVRSFHARLARCYTRDPGRVQYLEYPGVGHFLTPELNADSCLRVVAWFRRWLSADYRALAATGAG